MLGLSQETGHGLSSQYTGEQTKQRKQGCRGADNLQDWKDHGHFMEGGTGAAAEEADTGTGSAPGSADDLWR